jgi:murein DD-endopeptidase MepM/ murein hydrolase activator NlpD
MSMLEPMTMLDQAALQFLQACIGCAIAGFGVWITLRIALRSWPALAAQRWAWLLPQAAVVAFFLLMLTPVSGKLSVLPALDVGAPQASAPAGMVEADGASAATDGDDSPGAGNGSGRWLVRFAYAWFAVYLAGLCLAIARLMAARRALRGLLHGAYELTDPATRAPVACAGVRTPAVPIFETDAAVSPMLIGLYKPCLLIPRHLRSFDSLQQQMVIAHELTHLRRRDPLWMALSIALQTALWFNPPMRKLGERLTWAQELSCDEQVLRGRAQPQRQAYAAALVAQLKLQQRSFGAAMAFGGHRPGTLAERMMLIRRPVATAPGPLARCAVVGGVAAVFAGSLMLQPAFASHAALPAPVAEPATLEWRMPLEHARVSSFFGVVSPLRPKGHAGIDFMAKTGTPILAGADGIVTASTDLYEGQAKYGKVILVAHGGKTSSLYAHLDERIVAVGDAVKAGQVIGRSGATGKVTGPHLHFEIRKEGRVVDPETVLAGLDSNATPSALRARRALPPKN